LGPDGEIGILVLPPFALILLNEIDDLTGRQTQLGQGGRTVPLVDEKISNPSTPALIASNTFRFVYRNTAPEITANAGTGIEKHDILARSVMTVAIIADLPVPVSQAIQHFVVELGPRLFCKLGPCADALEIEINRIDA
jgi:hypothetical protein